MTQDKSKEITAEDIARMFEPRKPVAHLEERHFTETPIRCKWCGSLDVMKYGTRKDVQENMTCPRWLYHLRS